MKTCVCKACSFDGIFRPRYVIQPNCWVYGKNIPVKNYDSFDTGKQVHISTMRQCDSKTFPFKEVPFQGGSVSQNTILLEFVDDH